MVLDIDDTDPPPAPRPRVKPQQARRSSTVQVALGATAGYVYFPSDEGYSGPLYSTSVTLSWRNKLWRVGLVLRGMIAPELSGTVEPFTWSNGAQSLETTTEMWGVYLGVFGYHNGFWGTASLGAFHLGEAERMDQTTEVTSNMESRTGPELCFGVGYDLELGDHVALRLGGELGTFFMLTWRMAVTGGVVVKF